MAAGKPSFCSQPYGNSDLDAGDSSRSFQTPLLVQLPAVVAPTFGLQRQSFRFPPRGLGDASTSHGDLVPTPASALGGGFCFWS